ncbi:MAG TPA: hypothetical protein VIG33_07110 [Pseudobdellovibrionaceae bacterium]|jgi:hypothetical protein
MRLIRGLFGAGFGVLLISFKAGALPQASDFKEVGEEIQEVQEVSKDEERRPQLGENEKILSGTVRIIRKLEMTEVFFKDLNDSYYIPSGRGYSAIYKALEESSKKGTPVSFKANTKNRRVLSLESAPLKSPASVTQEKSTLSPNGSK